MFTPIEVVETAQGLKHPVCGGRGQVVAIVVVLELGSHTLLVKAQERRQLQTHVSFRSTANTP